MRFSVIIRCVLGCLAVSAAGCVNHATVIEKKPDHEACTTDSCTLAGRVITLALAQAGEDPKVRIGQFLEGAAMAAKVLKTAPADAASLADYNFATARIFEILDKQAIPAGGPPLACPGNGRVWKLFYKPPRFPRDDLSRYHILPADRYEFRGRFFRKRSVKEGLGAPLIATSTEMDATEKDPFTLNRKTYYALTGTLTFQGDSCAVSCSDPLGTESVVLDGKTFPLAADFTAPLALSLAEMNLRRTEIRCFVLPGGIDCNMRLARLQPYDPKKIPVLFIHGLGDSQATWTPMIEGLRTDPVIRQNYQFWVFSYPTGYPYPLTAANLRIQLDAVARSYPEHKKMIVVGHSMGAMISRTLMTDSGMKLWDAYYDQPPAATPMPGDTRRFMMDSLIFRPRRDVARVIFMSASHRGSDVATSFIGQLGASIIRSSTSKQTTGPQATGEAEAAALGEQLRRMPSSIDVLDPKNTFVTTIDTLPPDPRIPFHSIIGDRGRGGNKDRTKPVSSDGIVPYWSSHLEGAQSEIIIPSAHWSNHHGQGIAQVSRILRQHASGAK